MIHNQVSADNQYYVNEVVTIVCYDIASKTNHNIASQVH